MSKPYSLDLVKTRAGWHWIIKHRNGKTLAHSEKYSSKTKAWETVSKLFEAFRVESTQLNFSGTPNPNG